MAHGPYRHKRPRASSPDDTSQPSSSSLTPVDGKSTFHNSWGGRPSRLSQTRPLLVGPDGVFYAPSPAAWNSHSRALSHHSRINSPVTPSMDHAPSSASAPPPSSEHDDDMNGADEGYSADDVDVAPPDGTPPDTPPDGHVHEVFIKPSDAVREKRDDTKEQWEVWLQDILPRLQSPYMSLLRHIRIPAEPVILATTHCTCRECGRDLHVTCISFDSTEKCYLRGCKCQPAAIQLFDQGYIACAPYAPSIAISIRALQFCREVFVRLPPNVMGWSKALEALLLQRGISFRGKSGLRKRFQMSLTWFGMLDNLTQHHVSSKITAARDLVLATLPVISPSAVDEASPPFPAVNARTLHASPSESASGVAEAVPEGGGPSATPDTSSKYASAYLRSRCPLCFGREFRQDRRRHGEPDVIVCVDGNFTQKRRRNPHGNEPDPPLRHPDSCIIPDAVMQDMAKRVAELRGASRSASTRAPRSSSLQDDGFEPGMRVPTSVLDGCNASFTAADERRMKANTEYFTDTGLMALLCRHDRVLWLANINTAGEKQHYALVLVEQLFKNLPSDATVGLLYDIGCQLHRSCIKIGFLAEYIARIMFAISVFHAYGHQWVCQLIYHPRKCSGFGFTNGESCERFWASIKGLIAPLRVSGFHHRLMVLDDQVAFFLRDSFSDLGGWLSDHWKACQLKRTEAIMQLIQSGVSSDVLRVEWSLQIRAQTKPLPRQSRNAGKKAVQTILTLRESAEGYEKEIQQINVDLASPTAQTLMKINELSTRLAVCRADLNTARHSITAKTDALGLDARHNLNRLIEDEFLQVLVNASALKMRLRYKLCERNFEIERLERAYRNTVNERQLAQHTQDALKRREPGITSIAKSYNEACARMAELIRHHHAPRGAVAPQPIPRDKVFSLDVDDEIWRDVDLNDSDNRDDPNSPTTVPRWLGDQDVRDGIPAMLSLDRCEEEERRLGEEVCTSREWACTEWLAVEVAKTQTDNEGLLFLLNEKGLDIERYCAVWAKHTRIIPPARPLPPFDTVQLRMTAAKLLGVLSGGPPHAIIPDALAVRQLEQTSVHHLVIPPPESISRDSSTSPFSVRMSVDLQDEPFAEEESGSSDDKNDFGSSDDEDESDSDGSEESVEEAALIGYLEDQMYIDSFHSDS